MKKISFLFLMVLMTALTSSIAFAARYNSLKFTAETGETYTVATENLEILVDGENLTFNNTDLIIPLASLVSMEFADNDDNSAQIDSVILEGKGAVTVYHINGTLIGSFGSYSDAIGSLESGLYVIKDVNGNSLKVNVEK